MFKRDFIVSATMRKLNSKDSERAAVLCRSNIKFALSIWMAGFNPSHCEIQTG